MKKILLIVIAAIVAALIFGCGGGGGGGGSSSSSGRVSFFATDDLSTNYDAVWVKVYKVSLRRADDSLVQIYNETSGKVTNLRALNDGAKRYSFFGDDNVPQGTYTGIEVELDRSVSLFPTGATTGQSRVFDDVYGADRARLDLIFSAPKTVGSTDSNFICDFDLSQWTDVAGEIRNAVLTEGSGSNLNDPTRHENEDFKGTVSALEGTAPNLTFTLTSNSNNKITVTTNSLTAIYNNSGQPNPTLINGRKVEVRGKYDPSNGSVLAESIKIKATSDNDEFEAKGEPFGANQSSRTFKIHVREAHGYLPAGSDVTVLVDDTTKFFTNQGVLITESEFFAMLPTDGGFEVEAEGAIFDAGTSTLTAKKVKVEDHDGKGQNEAEARGVPSALNSGAGTFNIALTQWEGFSAVLNQSIPVATTSGTEFKDGNGQNISQADFFTLLATATTVKIEGAFDGTTFNAWQCTLRVSGGGGGGGQEDPDEARGGISNINAGAKTFTIALVEWFGFNGVAGQQVNVTMSETATYRNLDGESVTAEAFFAQLASNPLAEVDGTYSNGAFTAVKAKLED